MLVTAIEDQKRDPAKSNVYLDGQFAFSLLKQDVLYFRIKVGEELSEDTFQYIQDSLLYIRAQEIALHFIGYKMRTEAEVRRKLEEKEVQPEIRDRVMEFLKKYDYVNDVLYVQKYVQERERLAPRGKNLLQLELRQKGVAEKTITAVLAEMELDEADAAVRLLAKKLRHAALPLDQKQKQKLLAFLMRKGFDFETAKEAISQMMEQLENTETEEAFS